MAGHLNVEIKARCGKIDQARDSLLAAGAVLRGIDNQKDTYFVCPHGRLKLRQGNIENALIFYRRANQAGPKDSQVNLVDVHNGAQLEDVLEAALGVLKVVEKKREIYFIGNVKFHIDEVPGLGNFVEIEAIDLDGSLGREHLLHQCNEYCTMLDIDASDLVQGSYSDMV
jgi:predicted adenylyl cyclase CyaB